jgi:DNA-binding FrmR family transcriptional regulator
MDARSRKEADARLRRIAGQVAGIKRMLDEDRYCIDVLIQIASVQAALTQTSKVLLAGHLETCVAQALTSGSRREREQKIAEVVDMFARFYGTPSLRSGRRKGPR